MAPQFQYVHCWILWLLRKTYQLLFSKTLIVKVIQPMAIKKDWTFICNNFFESYERNWSDIFMFDGSSNVQLGGKLLKVHFPKLTVMREVEHTVSLFFNDVSKIPIANQIISAYKMIYNIFGSGIYNKPHSIFKSKYQEFQNRNISLFSGK